MSDLSFLLYPFASDPSPRNLTLSGTLSRYQTQLVLHYQLKGYLDSVILPLPTHPPRRRDGLWQHTCFECFVGLQGAPTYWELNMSPTGDWNLYRFEGYRQGMTEEQAIAALPFECQRNAEAFTLTLKLDLTAIIPAQHALEIGMSAVLKSENEGLSYWALAHPHSQPDFHQRASFTLKR